MIGNRGAVVLLAGLAGLLLVLAVVSGWQGTARLSGRTDESARVEEAVRAFINAYGTFDFRAPDAHRQQLLDFTTGDLRAAVLASETDPAALVRKSDMTTQVTAVQVTALSGDAATASVTAVQYSQGVDPASGRQTEDRVSRRQICRLVREGGRWLVAEVRLVSEEPREPRMRD